MDHSASRPATQHPAPSAHPPRTEQQESGGHKPAWLREGEERLRGYRSLWETLTEEDWEFLRNYDGPEVLGPPPPPPMKRRPRRRGET
jgi:hypothetical protein